MAKANKPPGYWTRERCIESALNFDTVGAWSKSESGAYMASKRGGWFEDCIAHMRAPISRKVSPADWDDWLGNNRPDIKALEPYQKAKTKILHECSRGHQWEVAPNTLKNGIGCPACSDEDRGHLPRGHWTLERCMASASGHVRRSDWYDSDSKAVAAARRNDWYEQCCQHMEPDPTVQLTHDQYQQRLNEDGRGYVALEDYQGSGTPILHKCGCGNTWSAKPYHIKAGSGCPSCADSTTDNNAVYSWIVLEAPDHVVEPLPGYHLVKSGVTSQKLGDERPLQTMRANNMQGEIIAVCPVGEDEYGNGHGLHFEQVLLSLGVQPVFPDIEGMEVDGKTEMRLVSDAELEEIRLLLGAESAMAMAA